MSKSDRYDAPRVLCPVHGKDCTFDCLKCVQRRDDGVWEFQCTTCFDILPYTANDWKKNRYALGVKAYTPLRLGEGRYADTKPWLLRYHSCYPANASMYQIPTLLHQRLT